MRLYVISALLIAFLAILFALQNTNLVTIQLFIWEYQQSLALVLLATLAIGVIVGLLVSFPAILRRNRKASRMKKQADTLTELVQEKEQAVDAESSRADSVKQNYEELLRSLGVIEPTTGLIRNDLLPQAIATQLRQLKARQGAAQLPILNVLMFKAHPSVQDGLSASDICAAVAQRLQRHASVNTWLYSDGRGIFTATTTGLDTKSLTHYSESLQSAILNDLPVTSTREAVEMDVSVGCAIAENPASVTANQLIDTAESALEQAIQRGRNRVRILSAS